MAAVKRERNDDNDRMVKRFLKKVKKAGILEEVFKRKHYLKPSLKLKKKRKEAEATRRREARKQRNEER